MRKHEDLIIVGVHTHADALYLNGYTEWVADGRPNKLEARGCPVLTLQQTASTRCCRSRRNSG